jgi:hypothetical protein
VAAPARFGCKHPVESLASQLTLSNRTPDEQDTLKWTWSKGAETMLAEFGTPETGDGYTLCVYDVSPPSAPAALLFGARAPAGGDWKATRKGGFRYRSRSGDPDGLRSAKLVAGIAGKAKISLKGKGDLLPLPAPAMPLPCRSWCSCNATRAAAGRRGSTRPHRTTGRSSRLRGTDPKRCRAPSTRPDPPLRERGTIWAQSLPVGIASAAVQGRSALGPRAGARVLSAGWSPRALPRVAALDPSPGAAHNLKSTSR